MEPVTILLATGAIAVYAAHRAERMTEKARRGPVTLPEMMDADSVTDEAPVEVLAVHVRGARLSRYLHGEKLKVRVKYGDPGLSIHCDTSEDTALPPPPSPASKFVPRLPHYDSEQDEKSLTADFGTTCLFLGQRSGQNRLRFRIMRSSFLGRTLAKAELRIPALAQLRHHEFAGHDFQLELRGPSQQNQPQEQGEVIGILDVALETRVMPKGELRDYLKLLGAEKAHEGFLMDIHPVAEGEVSEETEDTEEDAPYVRGKLITARHLRHTLPSLCGLCRGRSNPTTPAETRR